MKYIYIYIYIIYIYIYIYKYFKNIIKENLLQEFTLKNIEQTTNYFVAEILQSELLFKRHNKVWTTLNYIELFLILDFTVTWCISVSAFTSLVDNPIGIAISVTGSKVFAVT